MELGRVRKPMKRKGRFCVGKDLNTETAQDTEGHKRRFTLEAVQEPLPVDRGLEEAGCSVEFKGDHNMEGTGCQE